MSWGDQLGGTGSTPISAIATRAVHASLPVRAAGARAVRRAAGLRTFAFEGRELPYLVAPYNETWRNERAVEVPIALDWIARRPSGPILEVGHVVGHYAPRAANHTVIDLYEPADDVLNVDALTYDPGTQFPSILAISTIEHVGYDEEDQDPDKPRKLLDHLATLLAPGGEMLISFPLGYHHQLDRDLVDGSLGLEDVTVMRRSTSLGIWQEGRLDEVPRIRYGLPFHRANGIAVGYRRRSA
jgi:hypothetical protein